MPKSTNAISRTILFVIIVAAASVFFGLAGFAKAQEANVPSAKAGISPTSPFLYRLDILAEDAWQRVLVVFGNQARANYLEKRVQEREAEVKQIALTKGALSDEAFGVLDRRKDYYARIAKLVKNDDKLQELLAGDWKFRMDYIQETGKEVDRTKSLTNKIRDEITAAREAKDKDKLKDLVSRMEQARNVEDDAMARSAKFWNTDVEIFEQLENAATGVGKVDLLSQRVAREEATLSPAAEALWKKILNNLDEAKKAAADGDNKKAEDLAKDIQGSLREAKIAEDKQSADERTKERLADKELADLPENSAPEKLTAPAEVNPKVQEKSPASAPAKTIAPAPVKVIPPAPKPALKTIPSETVKKAPLELTGYYGILLGQVGMPFEVKFGGKGGLPPYHFQLDSGVGFPPQGLVLDVNGRLSGTPTADGTRTFSVCVVDTAGASKCAGMNMDVAQKKEAAKPKAARPVRQYQYPEGTEVYQSTVDCFVKQGGETEGCLASFNTIRDRISAQLSECKRKCDYISCRVTCDHIETSAGFLACRDNCEQKYGDPCVEACDNQYRPPYQEIWKAVDDARADWDI